MAEGEKQVTQAGKNKKSLYTKLEDKYYALMDFVDQKLKLPAYKIFVNPLENHGIPSFPVFVLIILALIVGVGFLLAAGAPQKIPFEVSVFSEGKPIDGALVTLSCINGFNAQAESVDGVASFTGVPQTQCTATIEKEGFETRELSLTPSADKKTARATLLAVGVIGKEAQVSVQVADAQGAPITAALASYEFADQSGSGATDDSGKYDFTATAGATVKVFISKPEYDSVAESFVAAEGAIKQITLKKTAAITDPRLLSKGNVVPQPGDGTNSQGTGSTEYGRVVVKVSASDGSNVSYAKVKLYDDATKSLINSAKATSTQNAEFLAVAVGKKVFVIVESDAYAQFKSITRTVSRTKTQFDVVLQAQIPATCDTTKKTCSGGGHEVKCDDKSGKCTDNGKPADRAPDGAVIVNTTNGTATLAIFLQVALADQDNKSVSAASVTLLDNDNAPRYNDKTSAKGVVLFSNLTVGTFFTIMAYKDAYLPFWSEQFDAGDILYYNATLLRATENNSAAVKVKAMSYNGTPVAKAAVALFVNNRLWDYQGAKTTGSDGVASYANVPVGANASINVSTSDGFIASNKTKVVKGENVLEAFLLPPIVTVTFKAVDFINGKEVAANLSLYVPQYGGDTAFVDNCTTSPSKPCTKDLYTLVPYKIVADGENYAEVTDSFVEDDASVNKTSKTIQMFRKSDELVQFAGLYDDAGLNVEHQGNLTIGNRYYASFVLQTLNGSNKTVFFMRAGKKPAALIDQAAIIKLDADNGNSVFSKTYDFKLKAGKTINDCTSDKAPDAEGLYKWVEAELAADNYSTGGFARFSVPILALASDAQQAKFRLYYRAYAVLNNSNLLIDPAGDDITASTVDSKRCDWNASEENFTVENTPYVFTCEPSGLGCLNISFSQKDAKGKLMTGGEGFVVRTPETPIFEDYLTASFDLKYLFNPPLDPEELTKDDVLSFSFNTKNFQYYPLGGGGISPPTYDRVWFKINAGESENNVEGSAVFAPVSAEGGSSVTTTTASVGGREMTTKTVTLILNPPEGVAQFAPLPQGYYLKFNDNFDAFDLVAYNDTNKPLDAIDLYVDPIMPADAVKLGLYPYKLPEGCTSLEVSLLMPTLEDKPSGSRHCLSYDNSNKLLKYDASKKQGETGECATYSPDPNKVNEASFNITVFPICASQITAQKPAKVQVRVHANNQYPAVFAENAKDASYGSSNCYGNAELYFLVNNRQYGDLETLTVKSTDGATEKFDTAYWSASATRVTPMVITSGENISLASAAGTPYSTISFFDKAAALPYKNSDAQKILLKTVYRRANYSNSDLPASPENSLPLSAFTDKLDFHFVHLNDPNQFRIDECGSTNQYKKGAVDFSYEQLTTETSAPRAYSVGSTAWTEKHALLSLNTQNYLQKTSLSCNTLFGNAQQAQPLCGSAYTTCGYCIFPNNEANTYDKCVGDGVIDYDVLNYPPYLGGPSLYWITTSDDSQCDYKLFSTYKDANCGPSSKQLGSSEDDRFLGIQCSAQALKQQAPYVTKNLTKGVQQTGGGTIGTATPHLLHGPTCTIVSFQSNDWCAYVGNVENPSNDPTDCTDHPYGAATTYWENYNFFNPITGQTPSSSPTICQGYGCGKGAGCGTVSDCSTSDSAPEGASSKTTFGALTLTSSAGYYLHLREYSDNTISHSVEDLSIGAHHDCARYKQIVDGPEVINKRCLYTGTNEAACTDQTDLQKKTEAISWGDPGNTCGKDYYTAFPQKDSRCCLSKGVYRCSCPNCEPRTIYMGDFLQYEAMMDKSMMPIDFQKQHPNILKDVFAEPTCVCADVTRSGELPKGA